MIFRKKPTVIECSWKTELDLPLAAKRLADSMAKANFFTPAPTTITAANAMTRLAAASVSLTQSIEAARATLAISAVRPPVDPRLVRWVEKL